MALKFELDQESHAALPAETQALYQKHGDKFRLVVEGIDPADELKRALEHERAERAQAKARLAELETAQEAAKKELAEKNGEFERLWRTEQKAAEALRAELATMKKDISDKARAEIAQGIAQELCKSDAARAQLLKKEILGFVVDTPDGVKIQGPNGETTAQQIKELVVKQYPFLVDGKQSSGGGATGSVGGGATKKFTEYTGAELKEIRERDPGEYDRLHKEYLNSKGN